MNFNTETLPDAAWIAIYLFNMVIVGRSVYRILKQDTKQEDELETSIISIGAGLFWPVTVMIVVIGLVVAAFWKAITWGNDDS